MAPANDALIPRCRCGQRADFTCKEHGLEAARVERRGGQDVIVQPFSTYYLCAECCRDEVAGPNPPRSAEALTHHAAHLRREKAEALRALEGDVEEVRLGDWGRA